MAALARGLGRTGRVWLLTAAGAGAAWAQAGSSDGPAQGGGLGLALILLVAVVGIGIVALMVFLGFYSSTKRREQAGRSAAALAAKRVEARHQKALGRLADERELLHRELEKAQSQVRSAGQQADRRPDDPIDRGETRVRAWVDSVVDLLWHPDIPGARLTRAQALAIDRDVSRYLPYDAALSGRRSLSQDEPTLLGPALPRRLADVLRETTRAVLIGGPGAGKTMALRTIGLAYARDRTKEVFGFREARLAAYIRLGALSPEDLTRPLAQVLAEQTCPEGVGAVGFAETHLKAGSFILLFDDLHLLPSHELREAALRWIEAAETSYRKNVFVVATRPGDYGGHLRLPVQFREYALMPLGPAEAEHVTASVATALALTHHAGAATAEECTGEVQRICGTIANALAEWGIDPGAASPLDVVAAALAPVTGLDAPRSPSERLQRLVIALCGYHAAPAAPRPVTDADTTVQLLAMLAGRLHSTGRSDVSAAKVLGFLEEALAGTPVDPGEARRVLQFAVEGATVLRADAMGRVRFVVPPVQEVLTAVHTRHRTDPVALVSRLHEPFWHEVLVHLCCLLESTDMVQRLAYVPEEELASNWPVVWRCACHVLGEGARTHAFARRALDALSQAATSSDRVIRAAAVRGLGDLRIAGCSEVLSRATEDRHSVVRLGAARAMGAMPDTLGAPSLLALLTDRDEIPEVRCAAASSLAMLGYVESGPHLASMADDANPRVSECARRALAALTPAEEP